ncbi:MAG: ATP-binding cassette domain-containing protein [Spirochaetota bacterium]
MIEVRSIVKDYGEHRALSDVSFTVARGDIVGLLGPNGAGKTTTMRIITGFLPATSGEVFVAGAEVHDDPLSVKKRIGYMPENVALYNEMRVADYLSFCAELKGVASNAIASKVDTAMELVKLTDKRRVVIGRLSKGYRQRVGLAQAILHEPDVLILDEPTVGLDPNQIVEIRSLISSLAGSRTVIISSHILPEIEATCKRAIIINGGKVIATDTIEGLKRRVETEIKGGNVLVRVREKMNEAVADLRRMIGVSSVKTAEDGFIRIQSETGTDIRSDVARMLVTKGYDVVELTANAIDLEEIFIHLTHKGNAHGAHAGAHA